MSNYKTMTTAEIRKNFLAFFESKGCIPHHRWYPQIRRFFSPMQA